MVADLIIQFLMLELKNFLNKYKPHLSKTEISYKDEDTVYVTVVPTKTSLSLQGILFVSIKFPSKK